jgi:GTP-binding protein EngB required for normal cell division
MTKQESKKIDFIFTMAVIASNRNADKTDLLNAVCWDVNLVREGKEPTATKELV